MAIVARPQELVDEMEKLLAAAIADKVRLAKQVKESGEQARVQVQRLKQEVRACARAARCLRRTGEPVQPLAPARSIAARSACMHA